GLNGTWVQAPRGATGVAFEIRPVPIAIRPGPPVSPFALGLDETATFPSLPVGLRASSWQPNGRAIRFQFEFVPQGTPFTGTNVLETGFLKPDPRELDTLAV